MSSNVFVSLRNHTSRTKITRSRIKGFKYRPTQFFLPLGLSFVTTTYLSLILELIKESVKDENSLLGKGTLGNLVEVLKRLGVELLDERHSEEKKKTGMGKKKDVKSVVRRENKAEEI